MATIDLGKIKLVWRGTYDGATAYTVDDVVQHTDSGLTSSFICTTASTGNAPSTSGTVHGSWSYLAKGAAGSVLTTQGDILFHDGSGDQRLAKGTASQQLRINSGATAPEWFTASGGGILQIKQFTWDDIVSLSSTTYAQVSANFKCSITPTDANSKFLLQATLHSSGADHDGANDYNWFDSQVGTAAADVLFAVSTEGTSRRQGFQTGAMAFANDTDADNFNMWQTTLYNMYTPSTQNTNAREFSIAYKTNGYTNNFNAGQSNGTICFETVSSITIMEVASSIYS